MLSEVAERERLREDLPDVLRAMHALEAGTQARARLGGFERVESEASSELSRTFEWRTMKWRTII